MEVVFNEPGLDKMNNPFKFEGNMPKMNKDGLVKVVFAELMSA